MQTAALPLLQEVLAEGSVASDRERCAAYAGAARCAMTQGDLDGAAALLDAARSLLAEDARPPEVEQAALYLDLYREARELGALGAADDAAEAMASKVRDRCVWRDRGTSLGGNINALGAPGSPFIKKNHNPRRTRNGSTSLRCSSLPSASTSRPSTRRWPACAPTASGTTAPRKSCCWPPSRPWAPTTPACAARGRA